MNPSSRLCDQIQSNFECGEPLSTSQSAHVLGCSRCTREAQLHGSVSSTVRASSVAIPMGSALTALLEQPLGPAVSWDFRKKLLVALGFCFPGIAIAAVFLLRSNFFQISATYRWLPIVSMAFTMVLGLALTVARGGSGLGIPHGYRWPVAVGTVSFFVATTLGVTEWHEAVNTGFPHIGCILIGGLVSTLGVYGVVRALKYSDFVSPSQGGALIGIAVASSAVIALHLLCSVTALPHVLFAHGFSFVAAGAVGAHAGRKWLAG